MANFYRVTDVAGLTGINVDHIQRVNYDEASGALTIYFSLEHTVVLKDDTAKEFLDVLWQLKSEAKQIVENIKRKKEVAAKSHEHQKPQSSSSVPSTHTAWS
jgi:hypothetical protein